MTWVYATLLFSLAVSTVPLCAKTLVKLDKETIHKQYMNGDFDQVVNALEDYKRQKDSLTLDEQIFLYKYLGVIYSANPDTRQKGEAYLYSLLRLAPTATVLDMYIGDTVESIFNLVKERYRNTNSQSDRFTKADSLSKKEEENNILTASSATAPKIEDPVSDQPKDTSLNTKKKSKNTWMYWTAGGVGLTALIAGYVALSQDEEQAPNYVIKR